MRFVDKKWLEVSEVSKVSSTPNSDTFVINNESSATIVSLTDIKNSLTHIKRDWFGGKNSAKAVGAGVFWGAFITYIFPWLLDIAKVYCAIMIAKGFYDNKRAGKEGKGEFVTFLSYGKWYLIFTLLPWGVELVDQIGNKMLLELRSSDFQVPSSK